MSEQPELLDSTFVRIIHPGTGGIAAIPESALGQHYAAGWRLLAEGDEPPVAGPGAPEPVTAAQVAEGLAKASPAKTAKNAKE